jgi:hypothetical protein
MKMSYGIAPETEQLWFPVDFELTKYFESWNSQAPLGANDGSGRESINKCID